MARLPEAELEQLKQQVDLAALVRAKGIELKSHGKNLIGHCPFHDDKTPSFVVTPSKNLWHCMGACQAGGSVIDFVMRMERVTFRHAVELIRSGDERVLIAAKARLKAPKLPAPVEPGADDVTALKQVIEFYHETLKHSPEALSYLAARGIDNPAAIERFKIGFCDRTLGLRLPEARRADGGEIRGRLTRIGIYHEKTGREHFNGSIVIPVFDLTGNVTEVYGRKINDHLRPGTPMHSYLPGPHRGVWNLEGIRDGKGEVILCEALIDALSFWVNGYKNVTASYGVEGFTADHLATFKEHGVRRVYIAYDRDEAGDRAAEKLSKRLITQGIESHRVKFPKTMDANDYVRKMKPAGQALLVCLKSAAVMERLTEGLAAKKEEPIPFLAAEVPESVVTPVEVVPAPIFRPVPEMVAAVNESKPDQSEDVKRPMAPSVPTEIRGTDILISLGDREYRVRGLKKNLSHELMRVNVRVSRGDKYHVDTLDLYQAKARTAFTTAAASEVGISEEIIKGDLGRILCKLEELQESEIKRELGAKTKEPHFMSESERAEAVALLQSPDLLAKVVRDFTACGVIGEEVNKLVGYLAAVSRKLEDPLAVVIQSSSAAGKSSLMEAVLAMVPEEDRIKYSAMTGQSLFYMGEKDLKHKILAIAEEQGAAQAAYALKLLQSEGEISIASTGKDPHSGKLVTHQYRVEGPVMIFLTTTAVEVDEELLNRCIVLTVNEDREQTRAIHKLQRERQTLEGLLHRHERGHIHRLHQNAQRLLRSVMVVNPFAKQLTFLDSRTRTRRDHVKYLALIRAIALLHQYQRPIKTVEHWGELIEYIEVLPTDIDMANQICHEVLGRSLDELPPQSRRLLSLLVEMVRAECGKFGTTQKEYRFTRKQVREFTGWSDQQLQVHLGKLVNLEHLLPHRGGRGQSFVYELLYDGDGKSGAPRVPGLVGAGVAEINDLTQRFFHQKKQINDPSLGHRCPIFGGATTPENGSGNGEAAKSGEQQGKGHQGLPEIPGITLPKKVGVGS